MYTDDTILFCELDPTGLLEDQIGKINEELITFSKWCKFNSLTVNTG